MERIDPHGSLGALGVGEAAGAGELAGAGDSCASAGPAVPPNAGDSRAVATSSLLSITWPVYRPPQRAANRQMDDPRGYPFGSSDRQWRIPLHFSYAGRMLLEIGVVVLSIVCFVLLDLYVAGCERV